jgi:hypothetical protein
MVFQTVGLVWKRVSVRMSTDSPLTLSLALSRLEKIPVTCGLASWCRSTSGFPARLTVVRSGSERSDTMQSPAGTFAVATCWPRLVTTSSPRWACSDIPVSLPLVDSGGVVSNTVDPPERASRSRIAAHGTSAFRNSGW